MPGAGYVVRTGGAVDVYSLEVVHVPHNGSFVNSVFTVLSYIVLRVLVTVLSCTCYQNCMPRVVL